MHQLLTLVTMVAFTTVIHGAVYPWVPFASWWVRAPDKDIPPVVNVQQLGGNYVFSTAEGKAYQAVAPASVIQPPLATVHVQALSGLSVQYLPSGQAILVPTGAVVGNADPDTSNSSDDAVGQGTTTEINENETANEPAEINDEVNSEQPEDPAPVTEQPEDNEETESQ
ncbi:uncharacterized protein LOC131425381 [Malaya genurostris]|uniref:uncharacterized protein LOC131425381 n=1 Tax=Malaya genurostris TaxID=325434 RepID=UPI0026F3FC44|nr:uncharacterized protein LOC131425381 [Malaya genurostris]